MQIDCATLKCSDKCPNKQNCEEAISNIELIHQYVDTMEDLECADKSFLLRLCTQINFITSTLETNAVISTIEIVKVCKDFTNYIVLYADEFAVDETKNEMVCSFFKVIKNWLSDKYIYNKNYDETIVDSISNDYIVIKNIFECNEEECFEDLDDIFDF